MKSHIHEVKKSNEIMENVFNMLNIEKEGNDIKVVSAIMSALELPDREFSFVSQQILDSFEKTMKSTNGRLFLTQMLIMNGNSVDTLTNKFNEIINSINEAFKDKYGKKKIDFLKQIMGIIIEAINNTQGIGLRTIPVPISFCNENAKMPQYARLGDAGVDLYAVEDITIEPGQTVIVPTGIKIAVPTGYAALVHPRSGLSAKSKMRVSNSIGLIDSGYRGEIGVIIDNIEPRIKDIDIDEDGKVTSISYGANMHIGKGERFAQLRLVEVPNFAFYEVDNIEEIGVDRKSGFGGTGNV